MTATTKRKQPEKPVAIAAESGPEKADDQTPDRSEKSEAKQARAGLEGALKKMEDHEATYLWDFYQVMQAYLRNRTAPVEEFIVDLPMRWKHAVKRGQALTPDAIVDLVNNPKDSLRRNFEDAVETTRFFNKLYAKEVA